MNAASPIADSWSPGGWRARPAAQQPEYADLAGLADAERHLASARPVVAIADCAALRAQAAAVESGRGFILQGGDCAETLGQPQAPVVAGFDRLFARLEALLPPPVLSIGRIAGQFAKPRSSAVETRGPTSLPAYRGDAINGGDYTADARAPDPARMVAAHRQAVETAALLKTTRVGGPPIFTSHEALLLPYEQALARRDDAGRWWATSGHMLWVGDRSRQVDGAHVHFVSGIDNMVGVKCGPSLGPDELIRLLDRIDPANQAGKVALIGRFGAALIDRHLPPLMRATQREGRRVLWMIDPMHGNGRIEQSRKVRRIEDLVAETNEFFSIARAHNVYPAGLHLEMTPDDVAECGETGGLNFRSLCDPRLNAAQAVELVHAVAAERRAFA